MQPRGCPRQRPRSFSCWMVPWDSQITAMIAKQPPAVAGFWSRFGRPLPHCAGPGGLPIFRPIPVITDDTKLRLRWRVERRGDLPMVAAPLMPKATAVWLVENTALSFEQVADFCKLHPLEVKAIADGDAAQGIKGLDPILTSQLTREEIDKGVADPGYKLKILDSKVRLPEPKRKKGPRYTPVSRRQDRPNAILWLIRN